MWQVDTSPKVRHFMWKANNGALPVGSVLQSRGLAANLRCKRCGAVETEIHVLFLCQFASRVWELAPSLFIPAGHSITTVSQLLHHCRKMISLPPTGIGVTPLYPWILWVLWTNRNKLVFENRVFSEQESILKAIHDARAWGAAQVCAKKLPLPQCVVRPPCLLVSNSYTWSVFSDAA